MTFIWFITCAPFVQSNVKTLYIDVYMIVSSFRHLRVELNIMFHTSCFSTMFQYVYKVTESKQNWLHTQVQFIFLNNLEGEKWLVVVIFIEEYPIYCIRNVHSFTSPLTKLHYVLWAFNHLTGQPKVDCLPAPQCEINIFVNFPFDPLTGWPAGKIILQSGKNSIPYVNQSNFSLQLLLIASVFKILVYLKANLNSSARIITNPGN